MQNEPYNAANPYDYRQYDKIWQRVAPDLNPYPDLRSVPAAAMTGIPQMPATGVPGMPQMTTNAAAGTPQMPANGPTEMPQMMTAGTTGMPQMPISGLAGLTPMGTEMGGGSEEGSCCMGPAAGEMLDSLRNFIEDELSDCRYYQAFCRQAPPAARQTLRDLSMEEKRHACALMAVHYLITGSSYQPAVANEKIYIGPYCSALRERYHIEACGGMNYLHAADGTTDLCLQKLLTGLSDDEYCHAEKIMGLLQKAL